jgi:hypothetical protein
LQSAKPNASESRKLAIAISITASIGYRKADYTEIMFPKRSRMLPTVLTSAKKSAKRPHNKSCKLKYKPVSATFTIGNIMAGSAIPYRHYEPSLLEPVHPQRTRKLEDLAVSLTSKAGQLTRGLHPIVLRSLGALVRSMNCYYSNLIEGHRTRPIDIERALAQDFSTDPEQRNLQLEARLIEKRLRGLITSKKD